MKQYNIYDLFNMVEIEDLETVQESVRQKRRDATKKAKIRDRETALLRRNRYEKEEMDGNVHYISYGFKVITEIPDGDLWKPMNKKGREQKRGGAYYD